MYKRILLAYDGSLEGAVALREGALLAWRYKARVFILSVVAESAGLMLAESAYGGAVAQQTLSYKDLLARAVARLEELGLEPVGRLAVGEPVRAISAFAREVNADLVVVGHRRQTLLSRWWSGSTGAYLSDNVNCSVLIARNPIGDVEFEAALAATEVGETA